VQTGDAAVEADKGTDLQNAVKGVESQSSERRQSVLLVVLVMDVVQQPAAQ